MKFYLKKAFFIFVYIVLTSFISMAIALIDDQLALKVALLVANLALFVYIVCGMAYQDGQKAFKTRIANDKEREHIVETGEDIKLKRSEEYKPYKGFLIGFISCVPLLIILLIQYFTTGNDPAKLDTTNFANYIYFCFSAFANLDPSGVHEAVIYSSPYWALLAIPINMLAHGILFIVGAKKIEKQQQTVKNIHHSIYGE